MHKTIDKEKYTRNIHFCNEKCLNNIKRTLHLTLSNRNLYHPAEINWKSRLNRNILYVFQLIHKDSVYIFTILSRLKIKNYLDDADTYNVKHDKRIHGVLQLYTKDSRRNDNVQWTKWRKKSIQSTRAQWFLLVGQKSMIFSLLQSFTPYSSHFFPQNYRYNEDFRCNWITKRTKR